MYSTFPIPNIVPNWVGGCEQSTSPGRTLVKLNPATGEKICEVIRSDATAVDEAVKDAANAYSNWSELTPVKRGEILRDIALAMKANRSELARIVALETGKSPKEAGGETDGAIELGFFMAGEGRRFYGRTTTSAIPHRQSMTVRQSIGVAGLIIAANTPIANVAWKVFPALICGNAAVLKAAEDTPITAWAFGKIAKEAGLPDGVLNIVQGSGLEAGAPLVAHPGVDVISFTGSTQVGREIAAVAGKRLARVSLELGGKNPLVVCNDADLDKAVRWTLLSAFSNAGQRCAAASRIIVFEEVYGAFCNKLVRATEQLKVGATDDSDFGPVINLKQLEKMLAIISEAQSTGARVLTGGHRLTDPEHVNGFYLSPTLLDNIAADHPLSCMEAFGPIACLYKVQNFEEAIKMANDSPYGLTSCIHTSNIDRAMEFVAKVQTGVATINGGTYGSEPHMPFGGMKQSGNGSREPGTEALDVYSTLKDIYINVDPKNL